MNLYLDDDSAKAVLATLLRKAGHQVIVPASVGLSGADDAEHLLHAVQQSLVLLTGNHEDFRVLHLLVHASQGRHPGILVVRRNNDPTRDMKDRDVVRAIANLEGAGIAIENELHVLNHWR
jgi:predicted nuclease of predicted toxin-antitoxin system